MDSNRKKSLELFAKQLSEGLPFAEDFTDKSPNLEWNALDARDLSEDALAHQVMKNTGIPIPHSGASNIKKEDFLNRIVQEHYPEFKDPNLKLGNASSYLDGKISVNNKGDLTQMLGKGLHEAGHRYDDEVLGFAGQNLNLKALRDAKSAGKNLRDIDPAELYEIYSKGHHANIPKLREGSFGLGALKSMLKSGGFKALPVIGTAATVGAALSSPDASAAVGDMLVPGGLQNLGPSEEDSDIENPQRNQALRQQALKKLSEK